MFPQPRCCSTLWRWAVIWNDAVLLRDMYMLLMTYTAFCPEEVTNTTRGNFKWPRTPAEDSLRASCMYGAVNGTSVDKVRRNCSDRGIWIETELDQCLTYSNSLLRNISNVSIHLNTWFQSSIFLWCIFCCLYVPGVYCLLVSLVRVQALNHTCISARVSIYVRRYHEVGNIQGDQLAIFKV